MLQAIVIGGAGIAIILGIAWAGLAWSAGMFIPYDDRWAVAPGETTKDGFSDQKKSMTLPSSEVAYIDLGSGPPLIPLHGCPFSAYEWSKIIPALSKHYRVIAPDLLGLGDTPVRLNQDYRLPQSVVMVLELMAALQIPSASFIVHDHGAAALQLLMLSDPGRIERAIVSNAEAYDQWPSKPELPYLKMIVHPVTSPLLFHALRIGWIQREIFSIAVQDPKMLTPEIASAYASPHVATSERWQRLRRFFVWQLDESHNGITMTALPGMRAFAKPVLLMWGERDNNFGPELAYRLARDIPGVQGVQFFKRSQHMPMQEESEAYAHAALAFLQSGTVSADAAVELSKARRSIAADQMTTQDTSRNG
jgi:pimeloyl-ACP methyl ester carboxylesterase